MPHCVSAVQHMHVNHLLTLAEAKEYEQLMNKVEMTIINLKITPLKFYHFRVTGC